MIYVYDIMLNFNRDGIPYEFFEWESKDAFTHVKRMPLIKVNKNTLSSMIRCSFIINNDVLSKIYNLTDIYNEDGASTIAYASIFTDGFNSIAIEFNDSGKAIAKSYMLIDEEQETLILSNKMSIFEFSIDVLSDSYNYIYETRLEKEIKKSLLKEINNCYTKNNFEKLKYIYFECFGEENDDLNYMYNQLIDNLQLDINARHKKIYELLKLTYTGK